MSHESDEIPNKSSQSPLGRFNPVLDELFAWQRKRQDKQLQLLCERYGIPNGPDMYRELSLSLAYHYAPEFDSPKRKGRKTKWSFVLKGILVVEIERKITGDDQAHGVSWAATQLSRCEPWKSLVGEGADPVAALKKVYYETKDTPAAIVARRDFEHHREHDFVDIWESRCIEIVQGSLEPLTD